MKGKNMKKLFTIVMLAFIGLSANAQWKLTNCTDQEVSCFAYSGNNIFVGTTVLLLPVMRVMVCI